MYCSEQVQYDKVNMNWSLQVISIYSLIHSLTDWSQNLRNHWADLQWNLEDTFLLGPGSSSLQNDFDKFNLVCDPDPENTFFV